MRARHSALRRWVAGDAAGGQWIQTELSDGAVVSAVQVNLAEHDMLPPKPARKDKVTVIPFRRAVYLHNEPAEIVVQASFDGLTWTDLEDTRRSSQSRSHCFIELPEPTAYRFVRVTGHAQPYGGRFAVSGLRIFGHGNGQRPVPAVATATRTSALDATIRWPAVDGAQGYNIRYGLTPDTLYSSWLLYDQTALDLGSLNAGQDYWVAVDSFNENGVTRGTAVRVT